MKIFTEVKELEDNINLSICIDYQGNKYLSSMYLLKSWDDVEDILSSQKTIISEINDLFLNIVKGYHDNDWIKKGKEKSRFEWIKEG